MVSKTLKSKYGASAKFMFSRETCFSVPGAWFVNSRTLQLFCRKRSVKDRHWKVPQIHPRGLHHAVAQPAVSLAVHEPIALWQTRYLAKKI